MRYRSKQQKTAPSQPSFTRINKIPSDLISCIVFIEDSRFFEHMGFDLESIKLAIQVNQRLGYKAYGGSTITQQLARTLFLTPKKTYLRKYLELIIAVEAEILLSKERILELYLNYAEWGENIYGITDAANYYYNRSPRDLDGNAKIDLVTIMANPIDYSPQTYGQSGMLVKRYQALERFYGELKEMTPAFKSEIQELD